LAIRAQEKRQNQRKNGSGIACNDSGWRKIKKLEAEQSAQGKNQNSGGGAPRAAEKPDEREKDGRTQKITARVAAEADSPLKA